ncbi:hypothetical protein J2T13_004598 [Paenibacillus sp. DS2015]
MDKIMRYYLEKFGDTVELSVDSGISVNNGIMLEIQSGNLLGLESFITMDPSVEGLDSSVGVIYPKLNHEVSR